MMGARPIAVIALALVAGLVAAGDVPGDVLAQPPLCVDGHPVKRSEHVTYGGVPSVHGLRRDHRCPLCLGCPDTADNVWYEDYAQSLRKDEIERATCESVCRGDQSLLDALATPAFQRGYWQGDGGVHP
jgi:hypothetical protein